MTRYMNYSYSLQVDWWPADFTKDRSGFKVVYGCRTHTEFSAHVAILLLVMNLPAADLDIQVSWHLVLVYTY